MKTRAGSGRTGRRAQGRVALGATCAASAAWVLACGSETEAPATHSSLEDLDTPVAHLYLDEVVPGPGEEDAVALYFRALDAYRENVDLLDLGGLHVEQDGALLGGELEIAELRTIPSEGVSVVVALDHSNVTADGGALGQSKRAILELMEHMEGEGGWARHAFAVVGFADDLTAVVDFETPFAEARTRVEALEVDTEAYDAALFDGLDRALALLRAEEARPRRALVLVISDGRHNLEERDPENLERILHPTHRIEGVHEQAALDQGRGRILVHAFGHPIPVWHEEHIDVLDDLASGSGGEYLRTRHPSELGALLRGVFDDANRSLRATAPTVLDGEPHRLRLRVGPRSSDVHVTPYPSRFRLGAGALALIFAVLALAAVGGFVAYLMRPGKLILTGADENARTFRIGQGRTRIGSSPDNDIQLVDETIAEHHATIVINGRTVYVEAADARNLLQVNGESLTKREIEAGDRLRFGAIEARFER